MLYFVADEPPRLLSSIKTAIGEGKIKTWVCDKDGDFTHSAEQWKYKAWLRPRVGDSSLYFYIVPPKGKSISREVYAIYHGRFIESIMAHLDTQFERATASAMPEGSDHVGA